MCAAPTGSPAAAPCVTGTTVIVKYSTSTFFYVFLKEPPPLTTAATRTRSPFIWAAAARGGASFRSADAAQVCSDVGFVVVDGESECSVAIAARQIVSERW